ncbi:unnamed protein product, partial [Didymodactylos carnosus]
MLKRASVTENNDTDTAEFEMSNSISPPKVEFKGIPSEKSESDHPSTSTKSHRHLSKKKLRSTLTASRQIYFNHRYIHSHPSLSFTSKLFRGPFNRQIQYCIRLTCSFLFGAFLAYGTSLRMSLSQQFLVPVMSTMCVQETLGLTLLGCYQMLKTLVPISIFLFIVQKIGLGYHDYLELFVLGMAVAVATSLVIFPLTATFDIENRFYYALENLNQLYALSIQGFLSGDQIASQVPQTQGTLISVFYPEGNVFESFARSKILEQFTRESMIIMQSRLAEIRFEPVRLLQKLFNRSKLKIIDLTLQQQNEFISSLMFYVCSMMLMVKEAKFNEYHSFYAQELKSTLLDITARQINVVEYLTKSSTKVKRDEFLK